MNRRFLGLSVAAGVFLVSLSAFAAGDQPAMSGDMSGKKSDTMSKDMPMGKDMSMGKDMMAMPDAKSDTVLMYMKNNMYKKWALLPGTKMMREGAEPHGALQNVYANDVAMKGFASMASPMPDGSMIVKENYSKDGTLGAITIMYKKAGYNPAAGDYFWLKVGADMKVMAEGKVAGCISCHSPAAGKKDYILLSPMK